MRKLWEILAVVTLLSATGHAAVAEDQPPPEPRPGNAPDPTAAPPPENGRPGHDYPELQTEDGERHTGSALTVDGAPVRGNPDAPVTLMQFCDTTAPFCKGHQRIVDNLIDEFPGELRFVFRHFPINIDGGALIGAKALIAASSQGRFRALYESVLGRNGREPLTRDGVIEAARRAGLDVDRFIAELDSPRTIATLQADIRLGKRLGVDGVPAYFLNGGRLTDHSESALREHIRQAISDHE